MAGVAVTSSCHAWAVGYYFDKGAATTKTLAERWNGKAWKAQPSPNPGGASRLYAVAATSATDAWAVGNGPGGAVIEHWNGKTWEVQPTPKLPDGGALRGVAATSATNVWAVGTTGGATLVEHWNGSGWKVQPSACPLSAHECELSGVAATSVGNAWAAGSYVGGNGESLMLIEHWNGMAWKVQPSPNPSGANGGGLTGVAATSATNAWAVGSYAQVGASAGLTFVEHWNGKAWQVQASPNPGGPGGSEFLGVTATSTKNAWAVGDTDFTNGANKTLIERWNGTAWKVQSSPNPGSKSNALDSVAATSTKNAWAVGDYHDAVTESPSRNLALHWNGSSWSG